MANTFPTLAQSLIIGDQNLADWEASQLALASPFLNALYAQSATHGTNHEWLRELTAPAVGFRNINAGRDVAPGTYEKVTATLEVLSANSIVDKALADAFPRGGPAAFTSRYAFAALRKAFAVAESQIFYGTDEDADGFVGLAEDANYIYKDQEMVVNAGGDTADNCWSAWVINTDIDAVSLILGQDGRISLGNTTEQMVPDSSAKLFPAYVTTQEGWFGLQVASKYDMVRICNLDYDHPLTDGLIYEALSRFPVGRMGMKVIAVNRKAQNQVRSNRTATTTSGADAPIVTEVGGHPLIVTDALVETEAVLTATP